MNVIRVVIPASYFAIGFMIHGAFFAQNDTAGMTVRHVEHPESKPFEKGVDVSSAFPGVATSAEYEQEWFEGLGSEIMERLPIASLQALAEVSRGAAYRELIQHDPAYAAEVFSSLNKDEQEEYLHDLVVSWSLKDPLASYQWLEMNSECLNKRARESCQNISLRKLAHQDPARTTPILNEIESQEQRERLILELASGWAKKDINEAVNFLMGLPDYGVSETVLFQSYSSVMSQLAVIDPMNAALTIQELAPGPLQVQLLDPVLDNLAKEDFEGALVWTLSLETSESKAVGLKLLMDRYGDEESELILASVIANQQNLRPDTIANAFLGVVGKDPYQASVLYQKINDHAQAEVVKTIAKSWLNIDHIEAIKWLDNLPNDEHFEVGAERVAVHFSESEPGTALAWAAILSDEQVRTRVIRNIVQQADLDELEQLQRMVHSLNFSLEEEAGLAGKIGMRIAEANAPLVIPIGTFN